MYYMARIIWLLCGQSRKIQLKPVSVFLLLQIEYLLSRLLRMREYYLNIADNEFFWIIGYVVTLTFSDSRKKWRPFGAPLELFLITCSGSHLLKHALLLVVRNSELLLWYLVEADPATNSKKKNQRELTATSHGGALEMVDTKISRL